ncbi:2877_t:CDS:1 [Cetraspora pellucida]|uniref:2877_t:CDS:1 n=1 Tax=Cetraspora pellucida TaxID=1433469 RepID=A0ACA9LBG2_9GLOM|nr:2877_t:CDS:1 [Cetraspora pellucida]
MSNFESKSLKFRDSEREVVSVLIENYNYEFQKRESEILDDIIMEFKEWTFHEQTETVGYYSRFSEKLKEIEDKDNETKCHRINDFLLLVQERELKRKGLADVYKQNYLNSLQKLRFENFY